MMNEYQQMQEPGRQTCSERDARYVQGAWKEGQNNDQQEHFSTIDMPLNRPAYNQQAIFTSPLPHEDQRFVAALTYSLGWFSGLLFTLFTRESHFVRYHALQSLLFFGSINLMDIVLLFLIGFHRHHVAPFLGPIALLSFLLLNVIAFVGWLVTMVQAYRGVYYRLPFVGDSVAHTFHIDIPVK